MLKKLLLNLLCSFHKKLPLSVRFPEFYICLESSKSAKTNGRHNAYPKDRRCGFFLTTKMLFDFRSPYGLSSDQETKATPP